MPVKHVKFVQRKVDILKLILCSVLSIKQSICYVFIAFYRFQFLKIARLRPAAIAIYSIQCLEFIQLVFHA